MRFSAHISWLFTELPYLERPAAARAAGFGTIETAWPEDERDRAGLADAVRDAGVEVALLNCPAGDTKHGERGFVNDASRREQAERGFDEAIELAQAIGAPSLNLLVGRLLPGTSQDAQLEAAQREAIVAALRSFAPRAAVAGLRVLLEPVNAIENPGFLAPTPDAAAALIEAAGAEHAGQLGLLLDVYHVARASDDPVTAIERHDERIGHVQISDCPGRGAPGTGSLDFGAIVGALAASRYEGAVGLEYEPRGSTEQTLRRLTTDAWAQTIAS
jgi:hydroxypyruvate isomerase